jgi:heme/copper-type cytochrome/quinol oxidase subunit 4
MLEPRAGFALSLALTVLALVAVVTTGVKARVKPHIACVAITVALLGLTIYYAVRLGELYDLEQAGAITPIHLWAAKVTTAAYLLPLATGVMTLRDRKWRALHFKLAMLVLALTAFSAITGTAMLALSPALQP